MVGANGGVGGHGVRNRAMEGYAMGGTRRGFWGAQGGFWERDAIFGGTQRDSWRNATRFLGVRDAARHVATKTAGSSLMGGMRGGHGMHNRASGNEGSIGRTPGGFREDSPAQHYRAPIPRPPPHPPPPHAAYQRVARAFLVAAWRAAPRLGLRRLATRIPPLRD